MKIWWKDLLPSQQKVTLCYGKRTEYQGSGSPYSDVLISIIFTGTIVVSISFLSTGFYEGHVGRDKKIGKEIMLNFQKQNLKSNI